MRLLKFLVVIAFITILSLVYIDLQVKIYDLGYRGERKKTELQKLKDHQGDTALSIYKLKSVNHLGVRLLSDNSHMQFLDQKNIVRLETPTDLLTENTFAGAQANRPNRKPSLLAGLFSLRSQAEAEPIK